MVYRRERGRPEILSLHAQASLRRKPVGELNPRVLIQVPLISQRLGLGVGYIK